VGSLESRVLVAARRFQDLSVTDDELPPPRQVESSTRSLGTGRGAVELHPVDRRAAHGEGNAENSVAL
jgi:DNA recombination protein RmuC